MGRGSGPGLPSLFLPGAAAGVEAFGQDGHRDHARRALLRLCRPRAQAGSGPAGRDIVADGGARLTRMAGPLSMPRTSERPAVPRSPWLMPLNTVASPRAVVVCLPFGGG